MARIETVEDARAYLLRELFEIEESELGTAELAITKLRDGRFASYYGDSGGTWIGVYYPREDGTLVSIVNDREFRAGTDESGEFALIEVGPAREDESAKYGIASAPIAEWGEYEYLTPGALTGYLAVPPGFVVRYYAESYDSGEVEVTEIYDEFEGKISRIEIVPAT